MHVSQNAGSIADKGVGLRLPAVLSTSRLSGDIVSPVSIEGSFLGRERQWGGNYNSGGIVYQSIPDRLIDMTNCRIALMLIATPFVFIGGTIFGAFYGLFSAAIMGVLLIKGVVDARADNHCVTILLAPIVAVYALLMAASYGLIRGALVGALVGGILICDTLWTGEHSFVPLAQCYNLPILNFFVDGVCQQR